MILIDRKILILISITLRDRCCTLENFNYVNFNFYSHCLLAKFHRSTKLKKKKKTLKSYYSFNNKILCRNNENYHMLFIHIIYSILKNCPDRQTCLTSAIYSSLLINMIIVFICHEIMIAYAKLIAIIDREQIDRKSIRIKIWST